MSTEIRILLLADTHLGFDMPVRPRVERRRRGSDFLANYAVVLESALAGEVDIVVHGGDLFDRPTVGPTIAYQALEPLRRVAARGVPVFIVPGNHERARLPHARFASHPNVHVFDRARTFVAEIRDTRVALAGFPYERTTVRSRFPDLLRQTEWRRERSAHRLLCMHQCVEGATVGPGNFTFTTGEDVVRSQDVPSEFRAVLAGHIHRHQVLTTDLRGRPLDVPILYPGSIERTSIAEIDEPKGFMVAHVSESGARWEFRPLRARPMVRREVTVNGVGAHMLDSQIRAIIADAPSDAVLWIRVAGALTDEQLRVVSARRLRAIAPDTMNIELKIGDGYAVRRSSSAHVNDGTQLRLATPA
jgi:exonuclease SbcD